MTKVLLRIWSFIISLRLAVCLIAGLALSLSAATIIESKLDTPTAQYLVYRSTWFFGLLALLGLNILAVAISRWPWKKKHTPFLLAHAGILMILTGSYITSTSGIDGSMRIEEGEVTSTVELDEHLLVFKRGEATVTQSFPWRPAFVAKDFKPVAFPEYDVQVVKYISDADVKIQFGEAENPEQKPAPAPAVQIRILGAPMGGAPELWLWAGDPAWATQKMGPARFLVRREDEKIAPSAEPEARLEFVVDKKGKLRFEATSIRGEKKSGAIDLSAQEGHPIVNPGWKMPIQVEVRKFVPHAVNQTSYEIAKEKPSGMGSSGPNPAIQIQVLHDPGTKLWLGMGDRAEFKNQQGEQVVVGYYPKRDVLPFALRLNRFEMKHNPGTNDPAAYSSFVQVVSDFQKSEAEMNQLPVKEISMNEPLKVNRYTFYQASYIPDMPRPTVTILSVNYDPGRTLKYTGSILLILGTILLYLNKVIRKKRPQE